MTSFSFVCSLTRIIWNVVFRRENLPASNNFIKNYPQLSLIPQKLVKEGAFKTYHSHNLFSQNGGTTAAQLSFFQLFSAFLLDSNHAFHRTSYPRVLFGLRKQLLNVLCTMKKLPDHVALASATLFFAHVIILTFSLSVIRKDSRAMVFKHQQIKNANWKK